jgi:hypothetical protein
MLCWEQEFRFDQTYLLTREKGGQNGTKKILDYSRPDLSGYTSPTTPEIPHDLPRPGRSFIVEVKYEF